MSERSLSIPFIELVTGMDFALLLLMMNSTHALRRFALIQHSKTLLKKMQCS